jgi:hypothetical protein
LSSQARELAPEGVNDEPKPVNKVRFIKEKGKATAREVQQSPEAGGSLLR